MKNQINQEEIALRDYFADLAMQTILSKDTDYHIQWQFFDLVNFSYEIADKMMEARK